MRVTSARARALLALASGQARVVVASATALLPRLPDPSALVARSLGVRTGGEVDPQSLAALLTDGGYDRHDPVEQHGEFCLRGGILDVYPPNELWPNRVEFIGDMVESIRRFDPDTQRSVETLDQFMVVPVRESSDPSDLPVDLTRAVDVDLHEQPQPRPVRGGSAVRGVETGGCLGLALRPFQVLTVAIPTKS